MNLSVSISAWAELVWRYLLEVTNTVTEFDHWIGHVKTSLLTLTLTLTLMMMLRMMLKQATQPKSQPEPEIDPSPNHNLNPPLVTVTSAY